MKKVLSPDMVAHTWAHQSQSEATNSRRTFYFNDESIYSYGRHFCIAKHFKGAILFTTRKYSVSTSKHISIVRQACRDQKIIYCPDPSGSSRENFEMFLKEIKNALHGLNTAKKPEKYIGPATSIYESVKTYAQFLEVEIPAEITELIESASDGKYKEYLQLEADRIAKSRADYEIAQQKQYKINLSQWRKGKTSRLYNFNFDYLRINKKGRVETSQGVEIPKEIAKRAYKFIIGSLLTGGCVECEHKIFEYGIKEINKDFIKIGCHTIQIKEIKSMAKKLNF